MQAGQNTDVGQDTTIKSGQVEEAGGVLREGGGKRGMVERGWGGGEGGRTGG